jgi:hypothetical protein
MAQTSWPFEGVDTNENQYTRLMRALGMGVDGVPGDNNLLVYGDSSGMQVKVKVVGGNSRAIVRGHMYQSTAEETLAIVAAEANPRIDSVVLTLDPSANSIVLAVVKGTAAVSPVAPSLTQTDTATYQLLLAHVSVPSGSSTIDAAKVTDKRTFVENVWTDQNNRKPAFKGLFGYNVATARIEMYDGSAWVDAVSNIDAGVITSGTLGVARVPDLAGEKITSGTVSADRLATVPVSKGGTGATTLTGYVKGSGTSVMSASATVPTSDLSGSVAIANGGTGATDAAGARTNLGVAATSHTHTASAITDPANITAGKIYAGGTSGGAATRIFIQSATPTGAVSGDLWFW